MKRTLSSVVLYAAAGGILAACQGQSLIGAAVPFGMPMHENSGMSLAMGGASNAAEADYDLMLTNPAGLAGIDKTVFSALFTFDFARLSDQSGHTNMMALTPQRIAVGFPLGAFGTIGLSYNQRTSHSVSAQYDTTFRYIDTSEGTYSTGLSETGGFTVWQAGYGVLLWKMLRIGASYERAYYLFDKSRVESFTYGSLGLQPSRDSSHTHSAFNGFKAGLAVPVAKLRIGVSGEYFFSAEATTDSAVYEFASNTPVTGTAEEQTYKLRPPPSLTLGLAYDFSQEWLAAADASLVFWKFAITGNEKADVLYAPSVSFGGQYLPAPNLLSPKYWEIIRYRAGVRYTGLASAKAYEIMVSLGVGLPIGRGGGVLDVGVEGGTRVSKKFPGLTEDVLRIGLGFNGGRKWSKLSRGNY